MVTLSELNRCQYLLYDCVHELKPAFAGPCTKRNPVLTGQIFMHKHAVHRTCVPGPSGILSYRDGLRCTKGPSGIIDNFHETKKFSYDPPPPTHPPHERKNIDLTARMD